MIWKFIVAVASHTNPIYSLKLKGGPYWKDSRPTPISRGWKSRLGSHGNKDSLEEAQELSHTQHSLTQKIWLQEDITATVVLNDP